VIDDTIEPTGPLRRGVQDVLISDDALSDDDEGEMEFDGEVTWRGAILIKETFSTTTPPSP